MNQEALYGYLFGIFSVLTGAFVAYVLSFSRDKCLKRDEEKVIASAIVSDLKSIKKGFELSESYIPRFSSREIFALKGGYLNHSVEFLLLFQELTDKLCRIEDITKEDQAFNIAVASAGNPNIGFNNHSNIQERKVLIQNVRKLITKQLEYLEKIA